MRKFEGTKKVLCLLLCAVMVLGYLPTPTAAAENGLCEHHMEHSTEVCGYVEAVEGQTCTHVHDTAVCGYVEAVQEELCPCEATDESGALVHTEGCGYVAPVAGADCTHTHDGTCGYAAAVEAKPCKYECADCASKPTCTCSAAEGETHDEDCPLYEVPSYLPRSATPPEGTGHEVCDHTHNDTCGGKNNDNYCTYQCEACAADLQSLVDALPAMSDITAENKAEVYQQLSAIDTRKNKTGDATEALVNWQRYCDAAFVLCTPENYFGFLITKRYEATVANPPAASFAFIGADGQSATLAAMTEQGLALVGTETAPIANGGTGYYYLHAGTYTLSEIVDGEWNMTLTVDGVADSDAIFTGEAGGYYTLLVGNVRYDISIDATEGGTVIATVDGNPAEGETVTLTVEPNAGYELDNLTAKDADDTEVTLTQDTTDSTKYTFTMPASDVTVTATFALAEVLWGDDQNNLINCGTLAEAVVAKPAYIQLQKNVEYDGQLTVAGCSLTLDLNGNTLTSTYDSNGNSTFTVDSGGTFELKNGTVIWRGTNAVRVRGANVLNNGKMIMTSSTITGFTHKGVNIFANGTLEMNNAFITNNSTDGSGAGVFVNGALTMTDSTITGNSAQISGGGIHVEKYGTLNISGNVVINGNTCNGAADNVYLVTGKTIAVNTIASGSNIGVTLADGTGVFTSGGKDHKAMFTSDEGYTVLVKGENLELHDHVWQYQLKENTTDTITATCTATNCPNANGGTVTISASNSTYDGTAKAASLSADSIGDLSGLSSMIQYKRGDEPLSSAPTDAGTYKASLTVDTDKIISVECTIDQRSITIQAGDQTISYGGRLTENSVTITSGQIVSGDILDSVTLTPSITTIGTGEITPSAAVIKNDNNDVTANYNIAYQNGTLTINKANTSISFQSEIPGKTYDGEALANPTADQLTISGAAYSEVTFTWYKKNGEEDIPLDSAPKDAGTYYVVASVAATTNHTDAQSEPSNAVIITPLDITNAEVTLGAALTYNGTEQTQTVTSVKVGTLEVTKYTITDNKQTNAANDYTLTVSIGAEDDSNFTGEVTKTWGIAKKDITIKADDKTVVVGAAMPTFTYTVTGLVGNDTLMTQPSLNCAAADTKTAGDFAINISGASAGSNYNITYDSGTLKVQKEYTITISSDSNGTVTSSASKTVKDAQIVLTPSPKTGYKLSTLTVTGDDGKAVTVSTDNSGKYYFTMPGCNVTVKATFVSTSTGTADPTNPKTGDDFQMVLWTGMAVTSLLCMAAMILFFPRKKGKYQR